IQLVLSAIAWFALTGRLDADTSSGGGLVIGHTRYAFTSSTNRSIWVVLIAVFTLARFVVRPGIRGARPGGSAVGMRAVIGRRGPRAGPRIRPARRGGAGGTDRPGPRTSPTDHRPAAILPPMLQHVSLEVRPGQVDECVAFWELLGFRRVEPPATLRDRAAWV